MLFLDDEIGKVHRLEKGLPLVQAIPFRRDEWELSIGQSDDELWTATREELKAQKLNVYKNLWHQKKTYE